MHVVAAHMPDGDGVSVVILRRGLAGIGKAGCFLDGQRVHVGAQHDGRPVAVAEQADDAGLSDARRDFVAGRAKTVCRQSRRASLLHRQFGMRMHVLVKRFQFREEGIEIAQCWIGRTCLIPSHRPLHRDRKSGLFSRNGVCASDITVVSMARCASGIGAFLCD